MHRLHIICVHHGLIPLYTCMSCRRAICVLILLATIYVSSNYFVCMCVSYRRARAQEAARGGGRAQKDTYVCILLYLLDMCPHTNIYWRARARSRRRRPRESKNIYICPHTTIPTRYVSSCCDIQARARKRQE